MQTTCKRKDPNLRQTAQRRIDLLQWECINHHVENGTWDCFRKFGTNQTFHMPRDDVEIESRETENKHGFFFRTMQSVVDTLIKRLRFPYSGYL